jgi:uncharacterized protein (TIGR03437 family)
VTAIVNAASGSPTAEAGSWITITGANFGSSTTTWDNAITNNVYPTTLGGVTVAVDGMPAPLSLVIPTQINALVPATKTLGEVNVVVANGNGSGKAATLSLATASPGLFTFAQNQGRYAAAVVLDGPTSFEFLAPAGSLGSSAQSRRAKSGDTIMIFGTAFGPTTTVLSPEMAVSVAYPLAHSGPDITQPLAKVTIGGQPAQLLFCGIVSPGLYQINAVVPQVGSGDQALQVTLLSGLSVPQTVMVPIQEDRMDCTACKARPAFADITQTSRGALRYWVSGTHRPQIGALLRMCYQIGVPVTQLLGDPATTDFDIAPLRNDRRIGAAPWRRSPSRAGERSGGRSPSQCLRGGTTAAFCQR